MPCFSSIVFIALCWTTISIVALQGQALARVAPRQRKAAAASKALRRRVPVLEVGFTPTPPETVDEMLCLADVREGDVLYDLGSGDGRIPITAAKRYGIRAVGLELNPKLLARARRQARIEGVSDRVRFVEADIFQADLRSATVVTLYLLPELNVRLRPKLLRELRPGTRIVSHDFDMGDWEPERKVRVNWKNLYRTIYVWTVPERENQTPRTGRSAGRP